MMKKNLTTFTLGIATLLLTACSPLPDRKNELCRYEPTGTRHAEYVGEFDQQLSNVIVSAIQSNRPQDSDKMRARCGIRLSADSGVEDAAIVAAISEKLGKDWQYQNDTRTLYPHIQLHLWQTTSRFWPTQYFAIASFQDTLHDNDQQPFRPLHSLYLQDNSSQLHGYVVFGTIAFAMILPFVVLLYFMRRRKKRRIT